MTPNRALVAATWKVLPWRPLAAGGSLGLVVAALPAVLSIDLAPPKRATLLRLAALSVAVGTAFLLDDPARASTATVPTRRLLRHGLRALLASAFAAGCWTSILLITWHDTDPNAAWLGGITIEAATCLAVAITVSAAAARFSTTTTTSTIAVPAVLALAAILTALPEPIALLTPPEDPHWTPVHHIWALMLGAIGTAFIALSHET